MNLIVLLGSLVVVCLYMILDILYTGRLFLLRNITLGTAYAIFSFIIISLILFVFGVYSVYLTFLIMALLALLASGAVFLVKYLRNSGLERDEHTTKRGFGNFKRFRYFPIPLLVVLIIGFAFTFLKSEVFGMGQDQGVYQMNAMLMVEGINSHVVPVKEYDLLLNDHDREMFLRHDVWPFWSGHQLTSYGFYPMWVQEERGLMELGSYPAGSGIFHGFANIAAIISIPGIIFGEQHMMHALTIPYLVSIVLIFMTLNLNLGLSKVTATIGALIFALSPLVLWTSKVALTEIYLAMMIVCFIYFLTEGKLSYLLWVPVAAFSFFHVSVYLVMPMFLLVFFYMIICTKDFGAWISGVLAVVFYAIGYFAMAYANPIYTFMNYGMLVEPLRSFGLSIWTHADLYPYIVGICAFAVVVFAVLYFFVFWRKRKSIVTNNKNVTQIDTQHATQKSYIQATQSSKSKSTTHTAGQDLSAVTSDETADMGDKGATLLQKKNKAIPILIMIATAICACLIAYEWYQISYSEPGVFVGDRFYGGGLIRTIPNLMIFTYAFSTGFVILIFAGIRLFYKSSDLYDRAGVPIVLMFFYAIVLTSALFVTTHYYYYFARYVVTYIPIIVILGAVAIDKLKLKPKLLIASVSILVMLPFSFTLATNRDMTNMDFAGRRAVIEATSDFEEGSIILLDGDLRGFFFSELSLFSDSYVFPSSLFNRLTDISFAAGRKMYVLYMEEGGFTNGDTDKTGVLFDIPICSSRLDYWVTSWRPGPLNLLRPISAERSIRAFEFPGDDVLTIYMKDRYTHLIGNANEIEQGFMWTGESTTFVFVFDADEGTGGDTDEDINGDYIFRVNLLPLPEAVGELNVRFSLESGVFETTIDSTSTYIEFAVPAEMLSGRVHRLFMNTETWRPIDVLYIGDFRNLGVQVVSVAVIAESGR